MAARTDSLPWAAAGCLGVSVFIPLGGMLEGLSLIRPIVLAVVVLLGDGLFLRFFWHDIRRVPALLQQAVWGREKRIVAVLLLGAVVACTAIRLFGNLEPKYFNRYDDLPGYLTFPTEMIQLGHLPSDPFSERRIESSLGANYFLQTLVMVCGDARTVRFIDWGFGSLLFAGIAYAMARRFAVAIPGSLAVSLLTFLVPMRRLNATMEVLPAALFCFLFLIEISEELDQVHRWLRPALLGLTAGAICTVKSTYLAPAFLVCASFLLAELFTRRFRTVLVRSAICLVSASVCLAPWMIDQRGKEGTYLFPVFGRGYQASAYGLVPLPSGSMAFYLAPDLWLAIASLAGPFVAAIVLVSVGKRQENAKYALQAISFFFAIALAVVALGMATGGEAIGRYTLPFIAPGLIVYLAYFLQFKREFRDKPLWLGAAALFCCVWFSAIVIRYGIREGIYREYATDLGWTSPMPDLLVGFDAVKERNRLSAIQATIPAGEPILEHLFVSYGLNFRRNPIYVADCLGMAGPPPGMPIVDGADSLRRYLLAHSIRYVAFGYAGRGRMRLEETAPTLTLKQLAADPKAGGRHAWVYILNKVAYDTQTNLDELSRKYSRVYDDGEACVFDLKTEVGEQKGPTV